MALAAAIAAAAAAACALALAAFGDECMPGCGNAGYPGGGDAGRVVLGRAGVVRRGLGLRRVARVHSVARATVTGATVPGIVAVRPRVRRRCGVAIAVHHLDAEGIRELRREQVRVGRRRLVPRAPRLRIRLLAPATLTRRVGVIPRRGRGLSSLVRARGFRLAAVLRLATGRHCRHRGSERAGGRVRASVGGAEPSTGRRHATKDVGGDGKKRRLKPRKAHFTDPMAPDIFAIRYFYDPTPKTVRKKAQIRRQ